MTARATLLVAALLLGGCATQHDRVILLPNAGGGVGKVAVLGDGKESVISQPYSTARTDSRGGVKTLVLDESSVRSEYAAELAGLPPRPVSYNFFFRPDSPLLTAESEAESARIIGEVAKRPAVEVVLVGHSDTRGSDDYNEKLSLQRAMLIRARLIARGIDGFHITIAGQGERQPVVPTPDGVEEPRNRRVELHAR